LSNIKHISSIPYFASLLFNHLFHFWLYIETATKNHGKILQVHLDSNITTSKLMEFLEQDSYHFSIIYFIYFLQLSFSKHQEKVITVHEIFYLRCSFHNHATIVFIDFSEQFLYCIIFHSKKNK